MHRLTFVVAIICVGVLGMLPWYGDSYLIVDLAEMIYHTKELALGRIPYLEVVTHHFLGYAVPLTVVDRVVGLSPKVIWVLTVLYNCVCALVTFHLVSRCVDARAGVISALAMATFGYFEGWGGFAFNLQSQFLPFLLLYLLFIVTALQSGESQAVLKAGFVFGVLVCFDQRLVVLVPMLLAPPLADLRLRKPAWMLQLLGVTSVVPATAAGYLWVVGAFPSFFEHTVLYPLFLRGAGASTFDLWRFLSTRTAAEVVPCALSGLGILRLFAASQSRWLAWLLCVYVGLGCVYVLLGGRDFAHYMLIFVPAVIVGIGAAAHAVRPRRVAECVIVVLCLLQAALPVARWYSHGTFFYSVEGDTSKAAAAYIAAHTASTDDILVWGYSPSIYLHAERFTSFPDMGLLSVVGANFSSVRDDEQGIDPKMRERFIQYIRAAIPHYIVVYRVLPSIRDPEVAGEPMILRPTGVIQANMDLGVAPQLDYLRNSLAKNYMLVHTIRGRFDEAELYQRISASEVRTGNG